MAIKDEVGNRYGHLKVIKYAYTHPKRRCAFWLCQCDCGKQIILEGSELRRGNYQCCGTDCKFSRENNKVKNLLGQTFGELSVIEFVGIDSNQHCAMWKCKCNNCGSNTIQRGKDLVHGAVKSCGCIKSKGEFEIKKFLISNQIRFTSQFSFPDLVSDKNSRLFFDFALLDKQDNLLCLIEFQGIQHFIAQPNGFGQQQREVTDILKAKYCKHNSIPLHYITYLDDINKEIERICLAYNLL